MISSVHHSLTDRGNFRSPENPGFLSDPPTFLKKYGTYGLLPGALRNDFSRRFSWCGSFLPPQIILLRTMPKVPKIEHFIFDVQALEYMQNFDAISTGATISPYLSSRMGLRPKYFSEKSQKIVPPLTLIRICGVLHIDIFIHVSIDS